MKKKAITVMATFNAAGEVFPGMIVYPLQKISREIAQNVPDEWEIGRSKSVVCVGDHITFGGWLQEPLNS